MKYRKAGFVIFVCLLVAVSAGIVVCSQNSMVNPLKTTGRDDVLLWGDGRFAIFHVAGQNDLILRNEDATIQETLLKEIHSYKTKKDLLYVISREGYAILSKEDNICRLFLTASDEEYSSGVSFNAQNGKQVISRKVNSEQVKYLSSFYEFSEEERTEFEKMSQEMEK